MDGVVRVGWRATPFAPSCPVVMTPLTQDAYGTKKHDPPPRDQDGCWPDAWTAFKASKYGIFVHEEGATHTEHTERLGPLFTEVRVQVLGGVYCVTIHPWQDILPLLAVLRRT